LSSGNNAIWDNRLAVAIPSMPVFHKDIGIYLNYMNPESNTPPSEVPQAPSMEGNNTPPPVLSPTKPKILVYLLVAIIFVALGAGGVLAYQKFSNPISQTIVTPTSIPTTTPTANWTTYDNSVFSFSFDYPSRFTLSQITSNDLHYLSVAKLSSTSNEIIKIDIVNNVDIYANLDVTEVAKREAVDSGLKYSVAPTTVNNLLAATTSFDDKDINNTLVTIKNPTKNTYIVLSLPKNMSKVEFDQILSTFEFLGTQQKANKTSTPKPLPTVKPSASPTPIPTSNSITFSAPTAAPAYTVTLTSPNGGETLKAGSYVPITWNSSKIFSFFNLYYFDCPSCSGTYITTVNGSTNSYSWYVNPNIYQLPHQAKIRIVGTRPDTLEEYPSDESDNYFTISN